MVSTHYITEDTPGGNKRIRYEIVTNAGDLGANEIQKILNARRVMWNDSPLGPIYHLVPGHKPRRALAPTAPF